MAFVPEGQADRSQARSAWVSVPESPRPGGTVEVMARDIWRRNGVDAALETLGIPVERYVGVLSKPRSVQSSRWDWAIPHAPRHFVPGYDHAVPPGQNTFSPLRL
jgi:hypothetical protein